MEYFIGLLLVVVGLVVRSGLTRVGQYMIKNRQSYPSAKIQVQGNKAVQSGRKYIRFGNAVFFFAVLFVFLALLLTMRG